MSPAGAWVVPAPVAQSTRFKILGPIEVFDGDGPLPLGGPRQVALLALLLVHANQAVASDAAIEALWGGDGPAPSIKRLQMAVTRLRKALEPLGGSGRELPLRTVAGGYVLSVAPGELDAHVFEEGVVQGTGALARGDAALAAELLRQADARWRGPALADVAYEAFAQAEIRRLDELRLTALEARADADLRLGRHADVIGELEALLAHHPTRERLAGQLMLALYRSGRQSDALDVYQRTRVYLSNELGLEPGPALRQLQRSILAQDATLSLAAEVPADGDGGVSADDRLQRAPAAEPPPGTPARPVVASRKTATVLAAALDFEEGAEPSPQLYAAARQAAAEIVTRHGGTFLFGPGVAVLSVFGIPSVREDDVLRALRAADELRAELGGDERPGTLQVRIGVATGLVVAGTTRGELSIVGDPMRVSVALMSRAEAGEVLLSDATRGLTPDDIRTERLPGAWRLDGPVGSAPAPRPTFATPMVGRDDELRRAGDLFARVERASEARLLTVVGDAGLGKSRFAAEFEAQLGGEATFLTGRCLSYGDGVAFWPLREAIAKAGDGESREAIRAQLDDAADAELVADIIAGAVGLTDGEGTPEQVPWAFRRLLEVLAQRRPVVLVVEDAHWAEPPLLDLLDYLVDWLTTAPVMVLCLARPELLERNPGLGGGRPRVESVLLRPLEEHDALQLLEHQLAGGQLDDVDRRRILETAEGNPLFVEQLLAMRSEDPGWDRERRVPPTVQRLLHARLDRLSEGERACIERASVVGREFWVGAVYDLLDPEGRAAAPRDMGALVHRGLVRPDRGTIAGEEAMSFHHILIRDVAYETIPKARRAELHERFADWLDQRPESFAEFIGYHLEQAFGYRRELQPRLGADEIALAGRAAEKLADAGRRALARGHANAAVRLLGRAAGLLDAGADPRPDVLLDLGGAHIERGEFADAEQILARAHDQARAAGEERISARVLIEESYRRLLVGSGASLGDMLEVADQAIEVLHREPPDDAGLSRAYLYKAQVHWTRSRAADMESALEAALRHAELAHDEHERAQILGGLARAAMIGPRPVADAVERCHRILASVGDDVTLAAVTNAMLAMLEAMRGQFDVARTHWSLTVRTLEGVGLDATLASMRMYRGFVELMAGTGEHAEAELTDAYDRLTAIGERHRLTTLAAVLARILYAQGRYDEADRYTTVSARAVVDDTVSQMMWRGVRARLLAQKGAAREAVELATAAVSLAEPTDFLLLHADALLDRAKVYARLGRPDDATADADRAIDLYTRKGASVGGDAARRLRDSLSLLP
jgi:DNA-binding SARP family transcriptional activator